MGRQRAPQPPSSPLPDPDPPSSPLPDPDPQPPSSPLPDPDPPLLITTENSLPPNPLQFDLQTHKETTEANLEVLRESVEFVKNQQVQFRNKLLDEFRQLRLGSKSIEGQPSNSKHERNLIKRSKPKKMENLGKKEKDKGEYSLDGISCADRIGEVSYVDRISELLDGILVSILSCLLPKEAATTSVLSRQWRDLWASTISLNFEDEKILRDFMELKPNIQYWKSRSFVSLVDHVVQQHIGPMIERFRACFFLDRRFASSIDEWIEFAMKKRVQILELEFLAANAKDNYIFPHELLGLEKGSTRKDLHSGIPSVHSSGCSIGFKSLKVLNLQHVDVAGEVLEYFLLNCPVLERLSVVAARNLVDLRVVTPSIALKCLAIEQCPDLKTIEICNANIVSFTYSGVAIKLFLSNVPLLVDVSITELNIESNDFYDDIIISVELPFTQLSCYLSQLKFLKMDISEAVYNQDYAFPILANLHCLELVMEPHYCSALRYLTSFMKASPYLQRLVLKMNIITSWLEEMGIGKTETEIVTVEKMETVAKCPHHYLKVVEIAGYRARTFAVKYVMLLIKNAVALEKLVIDPVRHRSRGPSMVKKEIDEEMKARNHATKHLKKIVPSSVDFVCL